MVFHVPFGQSPSRQAQTALLITCAFCFYSLIPAQTRGRVVDGRGHPLAGATVVSTARHIKTTADIDGRFDLGGAVLAQVPPEKTVDNCRIHGGKILLYLTAPAFFSMEIFNLSGERIKAGCKRWLRSGSHTFDALQESRVASSVYILKLSIGKTTIYAPVISGVKRSFFRASVAFSALQRHEFLAKMNSGLQDTLEVSLDGFETTRMPMDSLGNIDTIALNTYSYQTEFYNGTYKISSDSITIVKRRLDTVETYCAYPCDSTGRCVDSVGEPLGDIMVKYQFYPPETLTWKYFLNYDTLCFVIETDTCFDYQWDGISSWCADTMDHRVDRLWLFTRTSPGRGLEGTWAHPRYSYRVTRGIIDSITKDYFDTSSAHDNKPWKENNKLLILDNGKYYERAFSSFSFAEGLIKDRQTCESPIPLNSNTGLQIDSCWLDISITPINATTVCLHGNVSGDSVIVNRLANNDLVLTSPLSGNIPGIMPANPTVCPDTAGWSWYFDFKVRNPGPWNRHQEPVSE
jgi:hypothetical protein